MKESSITFYVEKFRYIDFLQDADVSFLPPILRRRLSSIDKCTLSLLHEVYSEEIQNLVFSSKYGEVDRLNKIIAQYTEAGEVSPNTFAGSVHNYPAGFFLLNAKKSIPYTAISSNKQPITSGILTSVISQYDKILFCYSDIFEDDCKSLALRISKSPAKAALKYQISFNESETIGDELKSCVSLFNGDIDLLTTPLFKIERVGHAG